MKNIIKKIAATAMAFTLIGTGAILNKTDSNNVTKTLISHGASVCPYGNWHNYYIVGDNGYGCVLYMQCRCGARQTKYFHNFNYRYSYETVRSGNWVYVYEYRYCVCGTSQRSLIQSHHV